MYYFPLLDLYEKNKKQIHDMLFYLGVYLTLTVVDPIFSHFYQVNPKVLLLLFILLIYCLAFFIVRRYKLQSQFGSIFSHSFAYTIFFALITFWFYLLFVRRKIQVN